MSENNNRIVEVFVELANSFTMLHSGDIPFQDRGVVYLQFIEDTRRLFAAANIEYAEYVRISTLQEQRTNVRRPRARSSKAIPQREIDETMPDPCSICHETYKKGDSILTSCGHSFCKTCYDNYERVVRRSATIKCPLCRQENPRITEYRARKTRQPRRTEFREEPGTHIDVIDLTV